MWPPGPPASGGGVSIPPTARPSHPDQMRRTPACGRTVTGIDWRSARAHRGTRRPRAPVGHVIDGVGLRRAVDAHLGSRDVARVIYGSIIGLALVVALGQHPPSAV